MLSDIYALETLIVGGVKKIGGQEVKGTTFRFDCSACGVGVIVNGVLQGTASFGDLGSVFVDVFMDIAPVSSSLYESCGTK